MSHEFVANCGILYDLAPALYSPAFLQLIIFTIWSIYVFGLRKEQSFQIQRTLAFIPILKSLEALLNAMDFDNCPWSQNEYATEAYLKMGRITSVTFTYTFIHALFFMLCRGWSTTVHTVDRNQATNLTMVMGIIYLLYSAYYLSDDIISRAGFVNVLLALIYFTLGVTNYKCLCDKIKMVS